MDKIKFTTIDEYIYAQDERYQAMLFKVKKVIKDIVPEAKERISYGIPTFWQHENLIHFALLKNHLGIYPTPEAIVAFAERLSGYQTAKGTIKMPLNKDIDYRLIADLTEHRLAMVNKKKVR